MIRNHKLKRKNSTIIEFSHKIPYVQEDLKIICKQNCHHHLVHSFPLYVLSPYFHKAILFNNEKQHDDDKIKCLYLPFSCDVIEKLIEFAYMGRINQQQQQQQQPLSKELIDEIERLAQWTSSIRMLRYIEQQKKQTNKNKFFFKK